jgi:hypothetical protein
LCERAGAAHLRLDRLDHRGLLGGGELEGDRPARRARQRAELGLQRQAVHLHDAAIDFDVELLAARQQRLVALDHRLHAAADPALSAHREAPGGQAVEDAGLGVDFRGDALAERVGAELEGAQAVAIDVVQLPQGARRGISRVGEGLEPARLPFRVQALEARDREQHLAAHRDPLRSAILKRQRNALADAQVRGDVLADPAIAARRAHRQHAVLVDELDTRPIELRLDRVLQRILGLQHAAHALVEGAQLVRVHRVVERQHRHPVGHLGEPLGRRGPYPAGGGIDPHKVGVLVLQSLQLAVEPVVLRIRNLGVILEVVETSVAV